MNRGEKYYIAQIANILWKQGESAYTEHMLGCLADALGNHTALSGEAVYTPILNMFFSKNIER